MNITTKTTVEMTSQERAEREARRAAIREQVLADQQSGTSRDKKALAAEIRWFLKTSQEK